MSVRLNVREFEIIDALIASGRLSEVESRDRRLVERELADLVDDWARRWKV